MRIVSFNNEEDYYIALGSFFNSKTFSISYESNKSTGSYADAYAYRMRKLSTAQNLIKPIEDAVISKKINCNSYVDELIHKHNFVQNGKLIYGTLENVIKTVPEAFVSKFIEGYTKSAVSNDNSIILYEADNVKLTATSLKKTSIPKRSKNATPVKALNSKNKAQLYQGTY